MNGIDSVFIKQLSKAMAPDMAPILEKKFRDNPVVIAEVKTLYPETMLGQTEAMKLFRISYNEFTEKVLPHIKNVRRFGQKKIKNKEGKERVMEQIEFAYKDFQPAFQLYQATWK